MKGEINREWYCTTDHTLKDVIGHDLKCFGLENQICDGCFFKHRKHPTPEQFKEEYGEEYPDKGAVYILLGQWILGEYKWALSLKEFYEPIVCACTPWGKPPNKWRPE